MSRRVPTRQERQLACGCLIVLVVLVAIAAVLWGILGAVGTALILVALMGLAASNRAGGPVVRPPDEES